MVFKSRNVEIQEEDSKESSSKYRKYKYTLSDCKTFHEEVLLTLEVLKEEQNVDLYNGTTHPGMWLKNKNTNIERIFGDNNQKNSQDSDNINNNSDNIPESLINFFENGKK